MAKRGSEKIKFLLFHFSWFFIWILNENVRRKYGKKNGRFSFFEAKYLFRVNDFKINRCYSTTLQLQKYFFKWFRLEHSLIHSVNILEFEHTKKRRKKSRVWNKIVAKYYHLQSALCWIQIFFPHLLQRISNQSKTVHPLECC